MILMIDNYDSFTYNIVQYLLELGADLKVVRNDEVSIEDIKRLNPEKIILSPGPSTPDDAGITLSVIKQFGGVIPIFGVCLGHQSIGQVFGGNVIRANNQMHGKISTINVIYPSKIFDNIPKNFTATRYHSLVIDKNTIPKDIVVTAVSNDDSEIMALEIPNKKIYGVQFHPESIMSEYGREILNNFLAI
jgi:anthranilate synthase component 2